MASDVTALERIEEHGIAVDARAIEEEFDRIWRSTEDSSEDIPGVRVRVLNLVAVGGSADDLKRFEDVMQELPQRHPCRGIFAVAAPPHRALTASISAHCWRTGAMRRHVCSEEIVLAGAPAQERELASAVLGLLVPELPVVVWMMDEVASSRDLMSRVLDAGDSALVDSGYAPSVASAYDAISVLGGEHDVQCLDLAWTRLGAWRALIAQMFDGDPARELQQITQIAVRGGAASVSSEALLIAGWLASRLDFALADVTHAGGEIDASFYDGSRGVRLRIGTAPAPLHHVSIRTTDAQFIVERDAQSGHLHVRETWDSGATQRVVERAPESEPALIALTVDGLEGDATYLDAMMMARSLFVA